MKCTKCKSKSRSVGLRENKDGIYRRYRCTNCKHIDKIYLKDQKEKNKTTWNESKDSASLSGYAENEQDLIKKYGVDMTVWEFDKMVIKDNEWETTAADRDQDLKFEKDPDGKQVMTGYAKRKGLVTKKNKQHYIVVTFKRRKEYFDHEKFMIEMVSEIKKYSPKIESITYPNYKKDKHLLEISLVDVHYDKLGWEDETGQLSYDTKIASKRFKQCTKAHLEQAINSGVNIEKIIFVTSQDFFNSDSDYPNSATTKKTPQQTDLRWQKSFRTGWQLNAECINMCKEIAPVVVVNVPGNHDFQKSYYLGEVLGALFYNDPNVTVNNSPDPQRFIEYGKCLIGYAHNISVPRLKMLMQDKAPEAWGRTYFREWHLGDIHHEKTIELKHEDYQGLMIRWLKSLSGDDGWHNNEGYRSIKGGESFIWSKKHGMVNNFHYNLVLKAKVNSFKI